MKSLNSSPARLVEGVLYILGLGTSLYGLANVMPAFGDFRIGPFPMVFFRASFFGLCAVTVLFSLFYKGIVNKQRKWIDVLGTVSVIGILFACWSFYQVSIRMDNAMFLFGTKEMVIALVASGAALFFCWRIWGAPVALLGVVGIAYMATGNYWPGFLQTVDSDLSETLAQNLLYSLDSGILGSTFSIVVSTVFPFIILGAVLEGIGAGESMIRIAFSLMRRTAGGPAHAAVLSSALFGTVSGSAVGNVVGTGVVTIPMIRRRGFTANFAGAVEAAASTGGQIMPPIMGAAALIMADFAGVGYLTVIIAVLIPAIAYYASLFVMIMFETRRLGIDPSAGAGTEVQVPDRQDYVNLLLIFVPLFLIVALLIEGFSPAGASIYAMACLFPLSFINPEIRKKPIKLITSLSVGGKVFSELLMAIAAVGIVISALAVTGVPVKFAVLISSVVTHSLFFSLLLAALCCIVLGMGMPTLPAYVTVATIAIPAMEQLGLAPLTSHMFVFFIAVGSAITPPVAIAAYAAASISGGKPIGTSFQASKVGIMIFVIPFAFAYNPLLLTVPQTGVAFSLLGWCWLLIKMIFGIYLLASGLTGYDRRPLNIVEIVLRIGAAVLLFAPGHMNDLMGIVLMACALVWHRQRNKGKLLCSRTG